MNKTAKKAIKITAIALSSVVGAFLLLYAILAIIGGASYVEARKAREFACVIPVSGGVAPQGLTYSEPHKSYVVSGYDNDHNAVLFTVKGKKYKKVTLYGTDGKLLAGHAGGVTVTKDCLYVANDNALVLFSAADVFDGSGKATAKSVIPVDNRAAYCYSDDEYMFVGEFYRKGNYETEEHHHYTTPKGEKNMAIVSCYKLDENGLIENTDTQPYPLYSISLPGLVQGFAAYNGTYILSRSYGLVNSNLDYHNELGDGGATITVKFKLNEAAEEKTVPLYYLDSATIFKSLTLPAFSEDVTIVNGRVAVCNEASADRYFVGKLFGANKAYTYPIYTKK